LDSGLVFASRKYRLGSQLRLETGVHHVALPPAEWHGRARHPDAERTVRHRRRFDSIQHATRAMGDWINFYNN
jgi:putative transposase